MIFTENIVYKDDLKSQSEKGLKKTEVISYVVLETETTQDKSKSSDASGIKHSYDTHVEEVESDSDEGENSEDHTSIHGSYNIARDRPRREIVPPAKFGDYDLAAFALIAAVEVSLDEPRDYQEAMRSKESKLWGGGMDDQMESMRPNKTWRLVKRFEDRKVIGCKWVYRKKPWIP